jgi:hypothetical protein
LISYLITNKDLIKGRWSLVNIYPFLNKTNMNIILSTHGKIILPEGELPMIPLERIADKNNYTGYIKIQNITLDQLRGKEPVLKFKKLEDEMFHSGQNAQLGFINDIGVFVKIKDVKVKSNETNRH